jgi:phthalate 4,5-dioxygenase
MTREENELMCRVENDAPMGKFLRANYWLPATLSMKIEAGGAPLRVRILGEDFVIFRTHDGRLGMFDEHCPHRGASLTLARNEDNALRCIFHGWKFGVDGTVLEVPTEPHNRTDFCKKVPLRYHSVREGAGIVWAWIGDGAPVPFPEFEFFELPADQTYAVMQNLNCNWVQDLENGADSAHVGVLHKSWMGNVRLEGLADHDAAPTLEFESWPGGYSYVAKRNLKDGNQYCRITQFVMPWYCFICPEELKHNDRLVIITTPVDDTHCTHFQLRYNYWKPLSPSWMNPAPDPTNYPPLPPGGPESNWGQDRFLMKTHFTGFRHLNTEDFVIAQSLGPIAPRAREYLNHGDLAVVKLRRLLLGAVREFMEGRQPEQAQHEKIPYSRIRASAGVLPKGGDWLALND